MLVCGVDEAGRGSLVGPLVIAGVAIKRNRMRELKSMGVRDSKKLTRKARESLYPEIVNMADSYHISRVPPGVVDRSVGRHMLNDLEARYMARVITRLGHGTTYVDSCDVNPRRFGGRVSEMSGRTVRSYHRADDRFVIVSAASILAKVARDRSIERLRKSHDVGSGYPSDRRTVGFVRGYYNKNGAMPPFVRRSWRPARLIEAGG
ncbi:ribonuclease HII [Cenarchaeum symbiosum A]|uniref:Ribonuclease HII n=1 Tax=Cenarchaeum symbiosum (strain A) TaxID=414004 RepID=RNH2_CENSY|nr:RecName: Full=Ribonuclease HII; Short=RNase HII [Cenarchaeum symbiosum A]ABK77192.1 ribonuclease HII [Cenarchaeum symbiosum A]